MADTRSICQRPLNVFFAGRPVKLDELDICLTVGRPQHGIGVFHIMKPDHVIHPLAFHYSFPLQFKPKIKKKRFSGSKVVDDDTYMIYFMNLHTTVALLSKHGGLNSLRKLSH